MKLIAKTFYGLEDVLAEEIRSLGGQEVKTLNRAVSFEGDMRLLYAANLECRTALRILKPFLHFSAHNETVLYKRLRRFPWWEILSLDQTFAIDATVHSKTFTHSKYVALKVKDAIVDLFRYKFNGRRPSVALDKPDLRINVHCREKDFSLSLDSSGASLHRRGYRIPNNEAPLNEALAAGMVLLSGWKPGGIFLDPMCGGGTLLIEAAMIAHGISPRHNWDSFSFMQWPDFDRQLWNSVKETSLQHSEAYTRRDIFGMDRDAGLLRAVQSRIRSLGLDTTIQISNGDFFHSTAPADQGILVVNPPYGKRLSLEDNAAFYRRIGDTLKTHYPGWQAWVLSGDKEAIKNVGLRTSRKLTLYNGPIECKFHRYELFRGSLKS